MVAAAAPATPTAYFYCCVVASAPAPAADVCYVPTGTQKQQPGLYES